MRWLVYRRAFTMIELLFVVVILGIVASLGAEIIAKTYESYIVQRAQYRANIKTELAINEIANRLRYAIPSTIGTRASSTGTFRPFSATTAPNVRVLQWVGYDGDSFEAITSGTNRRPGWSGFCDLNASTSTTVVTPGSNLTLAQTIIANFGGNITNAVLYFANDTQGRYYRIKTINTNTISLSDSLSGQSIPERYRLAWSSYALSVEQDAASGKDDLVLYYNFLPSYGQALGTTKSVLLKNVTNFRFKYAGGAFRIKICKEERIGANSNATIHTCKEKVVF